MTIIRRTPRGVRGLKCPAAPRGSWHRGRTPRGVRGLKLSEFESEDDAKEVAPLAGCVD